MMRTKALKFSSFIILSLLAFNFYYTLKSTRRTTNREIKEHDDGVSIEKLKESLPLDGPEIVIEKEVVCKNATVNLDNVYSYSFEENNEWEPLHEHLFFRYKAHYFKNESKIRILAYSQKSNHNISCLMIFDTASAYRCLEGKQVGIMRYIYNTAYALDCLIPRELNMEEYAKASLYLYSHDSNVRTRRAFKVDFRDTTKAYETVLCSKQYNFTINSHNDLKYWLNMNIALGFQKIVIYNNTIPYAGFNEVFKSYGDHLEVRDYKYFPDFSIKVLTNQSNATPYKYDLKSLEYWVRIVHEEIAIYECYCSYRYKARIVQVVDNDEVILPRFIDSYVNLTKKTETCSGIMTHDVYFNELNRRYENRFNRSCWHLYGRMMPHEFMHRFMRELDTQLQNSDMGNRTGFNFKQKSNNSANSYNTLDFQVKTKEDIAHAKELLKTYNYLMRNYKEFFVNETTKFHRFLVIVAVYPWDGSGKSIHKTDSVQVVGHHVADGFKIEKVDSRVNYVPHFRTYNTFIWNDIHIRSVFFDMDYFNCYLKNRTFSKKF